MIYPPVRCLYISRAIGWYDELASNWSRLGMPQHGMTLPAGEGSLGGGAPEPILAAASAPEIGYGKTAGQLLFRATPAGTATKFRR
jgi:hypothetical protein